MDVWSKKIQLAYKFELIFLTLIVIFVLFYTLFIRGLSADEREHVYASFMMYKGFVPYRDFFEHHHPLMWYSFYPLMYIFHNSEYIWYAIRGFALLVLVGQCFFIVKICQLIFFNVYFSLFSVLFYVVSENVLYYGCQFRPDNLMIMLFLAGLYCWCCFVKKGWQSALNLSFLLFFLSVLALQKSLVMILPVAFISLYLLVCGKIKFSAVSKAMILPLIFTILFVAFWFRIGSLKDYFELNWLLNFKQNFDFKDSEFGSAYCWCAICAAFYVLFFSSNRFLKYLSFLFLATFGILQFFVYTPWKQYWLPVYPYFAVLTAYVVIDQKNLMVRFLILTIILGFVLVHLVNFVRRNSRNIPMSSFIFLSRQVLSLSSEEDFIVGDNAVLGGLRYEAVGYYWFGRDYTAYLDYYNFHRHPWPDTEQLIKSKMPKIIINSTGGEWFNDDLVFSKESFRRVPIVSDEQFLNKYYYNQGYIYVRND